MGNRIKKDAENTQGFYQYTVGEMADMLNMPAPTIRYYEQEGVVVPKRDEENAYRKYTVVDGNYLLKLKELRNVGATIADSTRLLNYADLAAFQEGFRNLEAALSAKLQREHMLLDGLRRQMQRLDGLENSLNQITVETRPALWRYNHQNGDKFEVGDKHKKARDGWTNYTPAAFLSFAFFLEDESHLIRWGFGIEEDMLGNSGLSALPYANRYAATKCVRYVFCIIDSLFLRYENLQPAISYIKEHSFLLAGDIIGRSIARVMDPKSGTVSHYYEAWLPISGA